MIKGSIKVSDFDKSRLITGKTGAKYLSFVIYENDQADQYGNTHVIKEDLSQEERQSGKKARIIGNAKELGKKPEAKPVQQRTPVQTQRKPADPDLDADEGDDVPF